MSGDKRMRWDKGMREDKRMREDKSCGGPGTVCPVPTILGCSKPWDLECFTVQNGTGTGTYRIRLQLSQGSRIGRYSMVRVCIPN